MHQFSCESVRRRRVEQIFLYPESKNNKRPVPSSQHAVQFFFGIQIPLYGSTNGSGDGCSPRFTKSTKPLVLLNRQTCADMLCVRRAHWLMSALFFFIQDFHSFRTMYHNAQPECTTQPRTKSSPNSPSDAKKSEKRGIHQPSIKKSSCAQRSPPRAELWRSPRRSS